MAFQKIFLGLKNFFFPPRCIFCRQILDLSAEVWVCHKCMKHLPFSSGCHTCQGCGRPLPEGVAFCYRCKRGFRIHCRKVFSAYLYEEEAKSAIVRFKRERYQSYAGTFAIHMVTALRERLPLYEFDLVVAVPPRKRRMRQQLGYDQAETLGIAVAREMKIPYLASALRQREVRKKQSTLRYRDRYQNVLGNYEVLKKWAVEGKRILLVDDICTTGATLNECARMLKEAGAFEVYGAVATVVYEENFFQI